MKFIESIHEMDKRSFEDLTYGWDQEQIENSYPGDCGDPDYVYDDGGELAAVFETYFGKYIHISYLGDEDKVKRAIRKYFRKNSVDLFYTKYADKNWTWDFIRSPKGKDEYTVAYRGGSGYAYGGGVYKV